MATFDTEAYAAALKIKYGPQLVRQVSSKVTALNMFGTSRDEWEGLRVQFPIQVGRAQSFMAHGSLGLIPPAVNEITHEIQIPVKWIHGRIQFEIAVMKASIRSSGAFARANDLLMRSLVTNIADEKNRMLSSGSGTGVLALVDGAGSGTTTLTVDAPGGIANDNYGSRFLQPGMVIAITDGTSIFSLRTIVSIGANQSSVVLDSPVSALEAPNNAFVVRAANLTITNLTRDTSYNNEPMGLQGIVDDGTLVGTFHNINRTTVPDFTSTRIVVSTLSLDALQRLTDTVDQLSGDSVTDHLVHHSVRRLYLALIDASRVFMQTGKAGSFDLGQEPMGKAVEYNGVPVSVDKDAIVGDWLAINRNYLTKYVLVEGEWAEETVGMFRPVSGVDALEAIYRCADNYSTDKSNAHGKLTGMNVANAIVSHVS